MIKLAKYATCQQVVRILQYLSRSQSSLTRRQPVRTLSLSSPAMSNAEELTLSDSCVKQVKKISEGTSFLRVLIDSGGCSGFQYKFEIDSSLNEDDKLFERDGAKVVIDEESLKLIRGSVIDYEQELIRCSFRVLKNPQAEQNCSCGVSFQVKE